MRGHKTYGRLDSQPSVSIKADWGQGVNTVLPGDRLPPMQFSGGLNISLREGYPLTRPGVAKAKWLYTQAASLGSVFQGGGLIQSADPDPVSKLPASCLVVVDNDLWVCCPNTEPILLKEDVTESLQPVEIIDAFDEALILRGTSQTPLRYRFEPGHFPKELPAARSGQTVLPNAETGCYAGNRVWLKVGKNEVVASDIFEWDYNSTETRWQIDDGENDEIVRLWPVGEDRIVVFKTRSIHLIEGVASLDTTTDPVIQITVRRVAAARGCVAKWGIAQRGQTLYYLGRDGLEALVLSDNAVNAMSDKPLSIAAQHYWNTLRWLSIEGSQMAIADQYLMISVPTRWREDEFIPDLLLGGRFDQEDIDLEPAAAAMTMTAYDPTIDVSEALTNYVEFPFFQFIDWRADSSNPGVAYGLRYRGIVRSWESGTVQMVGEMKFDDDATTPTSLTELSYKVWFGETGQPGSLQTVVTVPTDGNWHEVNWSGKPGALEHCEVFYGDIPSIIGDAQNRVEMWQYPDGMVMPADPPHVWGGSAGAVGVTACGVVGDVNDVDFTWGISSGPFTTEHYIATVEIDSTTYDDTHGFALIGGSAIAHLNASTLGGALGGTATRTIPDSATTGLRIQLWTLNANVNTGTFDCGPWFRLAYAPSVQQGVDPEG